jgi:hypothetical protein
MLIFIIVLWLMWEFSEPYPRKEEPIPRKTPPIYYSFEHPQDQAIINWLLRRINYLVRTYRNIRKRWTISK